MTELFNKEVRKISTPIRKYFRIWQLPMLIFSMILTDFSREFPRPLRRWDESASVVRCDYVLSDHIATADKQSLQRTNKRGII